MANRKMMTSTDNHGRRHGFSYIHECMGGKGIAKYPLKFSWPQNHTFVTDAQCLNLSLIFNVYKFFLKQYCAILTNISNN